MSFLCDIVDWWADDLTQNVDGLSDVTVHKYTSRAIEELVIDGRKHLAIWPVQDVPQSRPAQFGTSASAYATGEMNTMNSFQVLYWEPSSEGQFGKDEEDAAKDLIQLSEDMRARYLVQTSRTMDLAAGNVWKVDWIGTQIDTGGATTSAAVRYLALAFTANYVLDFV